jgi:hypothetical protein
MYARYTPYRVHSQVRYAPPPYVRASTSRELVSRDMSRLVIHGVPLTTHGSAWALPGIQRMG